MKRRIRSHDEIERDFWIRLFYYRIKKRDTIVTAAKFADSCVEEFKIRYPAPPPEHETNDDLQKLVIGCMQSQEWLFSEEGQEALDAANHVEPNAKRQRPAGAGKDD